MSDQPESTTDLSPATPVVPPHEAAAPSGSQDTASSVGDLAPEAGEGEAGESEAGGEGADGEASAEGGDAAATGEGKKRRRRRRKKKPGDGTEGATTEGGVEGARADGGRGEGGRHDNRPRGEPRNDLPLSRFLDSHGGRKSPFTAGDVVGGRVIAIQSGVAVIDLFGHGIAFAQSNEPRSLPIAPEEPEEVEAVVEQPDPSAIASAAAELEGQVGMPASESIPPPPPIAPGAVAVPAIADAGTTNPGHADPVLVGRAARALRQQVPRRRCL